MKRKLLSLTLVLALVLSLVPMGAFAAGPIVANENNSIVSVNKQTITADYNTTTKVVDSYAEFTVYLRDGNNEKLAGAELYVASSRNGAEYVTGTSISTDPVVLSTTSGNGKFVADANGKVTVKVMTPSVGTFQIGFFTKTPDVSGLTATNYINFVGGATDSAISKLNSGFINKFEIKATAGAATNLKTDVAVSTTPVKANGIEKHEWTVLVYAANGAPVAGEKVSFVAANSAVTFDSNEITTNAAGLAKVKIYSTKPGTFTVEAKNGDNTISASPEFSATGAGSLEFLGDQDTKIAKDNAGEEFEFRVYDTQGNTITPNTGATGLGLTASIETEPSGSDLGDPDISGNVADKKVVVTIAKKLQYEGKYVLRLSLENGKKVDVNFTVAKQGKITDINFTYKEQTIAFGSVSNRPTVERTDAAAVVKSVSDATRTSDFYFTSSDTQIATVGVTGIVTVANDKDNVGKKFTITAVDKSNNISKSVEMTVGGKVSTIKAEAPATAEVGKDASVKVSVLDNKGNVVSGFDGVTVENLVVINKAEGVIVSHEAKSTFTADVKKTGYSTVTVNSNKAGTIKLQIVLKDASGVRYSTVVDVNFGAQTLVASKAVVLTIGSKTGFNNNAPVVSDLAPFIQDGRTFVPVSFIAAQLGGTAEFTKNAAGLVDTVTVKVGNTTVVLTIGSTTIKVVKDGKESTVTTDVAPFIKSGRTVLPFRAVAEAFGAKVSFGPETGAVEWVKFEM